MRDCAALGRPASGFEESPLGGGQRLAPHVLAERGDLGGVLVLTRFRLGTHHDEAYAPRPRPESSSDRARKSSRKRARAPSTSPTSGRPSTFLRIPICVTVEWPLVAGRMNANGGVNDSST